MYTWPDIWKGNRLRNERTNHLSITRHYIVQYSINHGEHFLSNTYICVLGVIDKTLPERARLDKESSGLNTKELRLVNDSYF